MINLLRYYFKMYFKSNKLIAPAILWGVFLYVNNTERPADYVSGICSSTGVLYFLMIWIGFAYMEMEDSISEQILILKVKNVLKYNLSKVLLLIIIGTGMSIVGILIPVTQHLFNGCSLFTRNITAEDVVYSFLVLSVMAFLGAMLGAAVHPRIVKNRKIALLLVVLVGLLGYIKGPIIEEFPVTKLILWVVPPVYDILMKFVNQEYFTIWTVGYAVALAAGYGLILMLIYLSVLRKNRF